MLTGRSGILLLLRLATRCATTSGILLLLPAWATSLVVIFTGAATMRAGRLLIRARSATTTARRIVLLPASATRPFIVLIGTTPAPSSARPFLIVGLPSALPSATGSFVGGIRWLALATAAPTPTTARLATGLPAASARLATRLATLAR